MTNDFKLHDYLDPNKALVYKPSQLSLEGLNPLPETWLDSFITLCINRLIELPDDDQSELEPRKTAFSSSFQHKIEPESNFQHKEDLRAGLQVIYRRLKGDFNRDIGELTPSETVATVLKLEEGVGLCSDGFYNRVQEIVSGYQSPKTLHQLLTAVRTNLVAEVADRMSGYVHAHNQVYMVASALGLGVFVKNPDDPHGTLNSKSIKESLQAIFDKEYRPLNLPYLLCGVMKDSLTRLGYVGAKSGGYEELSSDDEDDDISSANTNAFDLVYRPEMREAFQAYIHHIFNDVLGEEHRGENGIIQTKDLFITDSDSGQVVDIHWHSIEMLFFTMLSKLGVILPGAFDLDQLSTLVDCAQRATYFALNSPELLGIEEQILDSSYKEINAFQRDITFVADQYPAYFQAFVDKLGTSLSVDFKQCLLMCCLLNTGSLDLAVASSINLDTLNKHQLFKVSLAFLSAQKHADVEPLLSLAFQKPLLKYKGSADSPVEIKLIKALVQASKTNNLQGHLAKLLAHIVNKSDPGVFGQNYFEKIYGVESIEIYINRFSSVVECLNESGVLSDQKNISKLLRKNWIDFFRLPAMQNKKNLRGGIADIFSAAIFTHVTMMLLILTIELSSFHLKKRLFFYDLAVTGLRMLFSTLPAFSLAHLVAKYAGSERALSRALEKYAKFNFGMLLLAEAPVILLLLDFQGYNVQLTESNVRRAIAGILYFSPVIFQLGSQLSTFISNQSIYSEKFETLFQLEAEAPSGADSLPGEQTYLLGNGSQPRFFQAISGSSDGGAGVSFDRDETIKKRVKSL